MSVSTASSIAAVGLFSSGVAAGLTLSYPLIINKLFLDPALPTARRLTIWNKAYEAGKASIPLTALAAAGSYLVGAYRYPRVGASERAASVASVLHVAIIPFTLILIKPINDTLISMRQKAESHGSTESTSETESGSLLKRWVFLHNCRCALVCAGFAVGLGNVLGVFL